MICVFCCRIVVTAATPRRGPTAVARVLKTTGTTMTTFLINADYTNSNNIKFAFIRVIRIIRYFHVNFRELIINSWKIHGNYM